MWLSTPLVRVAMIAAAASQPSPPTLGMDQQVPQWLWVGPDDACGGATIRFQQLDRATIRCVTADPPTRTSGGRTIIPTPARPERRLRWAIHQKTSYAGSLTRGSIPPWKNCAASLQTAPSGSTARRASAAV